MLMINTQRTEIADELLVALQKGLPIRPRPFAALGEQLGISEEEVIGGVRSLFNEGRARRLGAVFDLHRLGYESSLCAVNPPPDAMPEIVSQLVRHPGISHCYERGWPTDLNPHAFAGKPEPETPNLWFTLACRKGFFNAELDRLRHQIRPQQIWSLPSVKRFKIGVIFDPRRRPINRGSEVPGQWRYAAGQPAAEEPGKLPDFTPEEKQLIRHLQGNLPITKPFFDSIARDVGYRPKQLINLLKQWSKAGVLRRFGLILHHRKAGFKANGMCMWNVPDATLAKAGGTLTAFPEVTHCYERRAVPGVPFNLYAMIHGAEWKATVDMFTQLSRAAGLTNGRILFSLREFKKTSPQYFCESASV